MSGAQAVKPQIGQGFGVMWVGMWAMGREVRDTQGKVQPEVGKGMPKGKGRCWAQRTSELEAGNQGQGGGCSPVLTPASEMPSSSRQDGEPGKLLPELG